MRIDRSSSTSFVPDDWLEMQCRVVEAAGRDLAITVGQVNQRIEQARTGQLGRRRPITELQLRMAEAAYKKLHDVQVAVQNALFDCEHELRALRDRELSPAELLVDGERLIRQYRFLRRRARVIDGLLAYLPVVTAHAGTCLEYLHQLQRGREINVPLKVPDCGFALAALDQLREEGRPP
jgi:hypothetical protein